MNKFIFIIIVSISIFSCNKEVINEMEKFEGTWVQTKATINGIDVFINTREVSIEIYGSDKQFSNFTEIARYRWNDEIISTVVGRYEIINEGEFIDRKQESLVIRQKILTFNNEELNYTFKINDRTYNVTYLKQ
jgi:hypothetical protein